MRLQITVLAGNAAALITSGVVGSALPSIASELGVASAEELWLVDAFVVGVVAVLPLSAWLIDRFGAARLTAIASALLAVVSAASAAAPSYGWLVALAVAQGMCAAPILPATQAAVAAAYGGERLARGMALWNAGSMGGWLVGMLFGGWVATELDWRIGFFAAPVLGAIAAAAALGLPRIDRPTGERPAMVGGVLVTVATAAAVVGLNASDELGWASPVVLGTLALAVVTALLLRTHLRRTDRPIVHLEVLRHRPTAIAVGLNLLAAAASTGQIENDLIGGALRFSTELVGVRGALGGLALLVGISVAGRWLDRAGMRRMLIAGLAVTVVGTAAFFLYRPGIGFDTALWPEVTRNFGVAVATVAFGVLAYRGVETGRHAHVAAVYVLSTWIGRALGLALLGSIEAARQGALAAAGAGDVAAEVGGAITAIAVELGLVAAALVLAVAAVRPRRAAAAA